MEDGVAGNEDKGDGGFAQRIRPACRSLNVHTHLPLSRFSSSQFYDGNNDSEQFSSSPPTV